MDSKKTGKKVPEGTATVSGKTKKTNRVPFDTFDLFFFTTQEMPYVIIEKACNSLWCHAAVAVSLSKYDLYRLAVLGLERAERNDGVSFDPELGAFERPDDEDETRDHRTLYLFESTTDTYPCAATGMRSPGVKLCVLSNRLQGIAYGYKRASIKYSSLSVSELEKKKKTLVTSIIPRFLGIPYEKDILRFGKAWSFYFLGCHTSGNSDDKSIFCTELLTKVFYELGALRGREEPVDSYGPWCYMWSCILNRYEREDENMNRIPGKWGDYDGRFYVDEDLVPEDYANIEKTKYWMPDCWLSYSNLKMVGRIK